MRGYRQFCGLAVALDLIGDRWNLLVVRELLIGPRRFAELRDALPGVASNLLAERLRTLEDSGLLTRDDAPGRKAVTYALTEDGQTLREPVLALVRWGARRMAAGPRPDDAVRPQWVGLAAQALLEPRTGPLDVRTTTGDGDVTLTLSTAARTATVQGPPAAVLGTVAGALPPGAAPGVHVDDADGLLATGTRGVGGGAGPVRAG